LDALHTEETQNKHARFLRINSCREALVCLFWTDGAAAATPDIICVEAHMHFEGFSFGLIRIDGVSYEHDVVIDRGKVRKRKKKASKRFRDHFGHTPLSVEEEIPWKCRRLVIGTGGGALPVMQEVKLEAKRRKVDLLVLPTEQAIDVLKQEPAKTNAILHVTC
jgi:hypothetical protein